MNATGKRVFLLLICAQGLHSIEEYYFALWEVLAPARFVSGLVSEDLSFGFAVVNVTIVALGFWTYAWPVRRNSGYAVNLAWFWTILEAANGVGHLMFALASRSYFPGAYTAPMLLLFSGLLAMQLLRGKQAA
jgi:asparagine N-glycosylation enzyme membrane subunit Stt3